MKIIYLEEEGIKTFEENRIETARYRQWAEKRERLKEPITITLHVEIDKEKYTRLKEKYRTSLPERIFTYFGFKK